MHGLLGSHMNAMHVTHKEKFLHMKELRQTSRMTDRRKDGPAGSPGGVTTSQVKGFHLDTKKAWQRVGNSYTAR